MSNMQKLWDKGLLVHIKAGVWSMEARLDAEDIGKETNEIPEFVTLGYKRLFDKRTHNKFSRIVSNARASLQKYGFNFFLIGSHFIPKASIPNLVPVLERCKEQFYVQVDMFLEEYEEEKNLFLQQYPESKEMLEPFYPEPEFVREKFYFQIYCYTVDSTPSAVAFDGLMDTLEEDMYVDWATDTVNQLRAEAREVADSLTEAVRGGNLDGRKMRKIRTLVDRVADMDLSEDRNFKNAANKALEIPSVDSFQNLKAVAVNINKAAMRKVII